MRRSIAGLAVCALTACSAVPHAIPALTPGEWTSPLGDGRNTASLAGRVPPSPAVAWELDVGRGLPVQPVVQDDLVLAVVSGGGIVTASASSGRRYWTRRFNGGVVGQALRVDQRVYFATQHRDGTVYALDLQRGRRAWSRRLGARPAAAPAWLDGTLYVATDRGELVMIDARDGGITGRSRLGAVATQAPFVVGDQLVIATTRDSLLHVDRTGAVRARTGIAGPVSAPLAAAGDTLVLALFPGTVAAYTGGGTRLLWRHQFEAPVLAAPVLAPDGVYVLTRDADVFRIDGSRVQRLAALDGAAVGSLTVADNGILVGRLDGTLTFLDRSGATVWEQRLGGSLRAPPLVVGNAVYAGTLGGRLVKVAQ